MQHSGESKSSSQCVECLAQEWSFYRKGALLGRFATAFETLVKAKRRAYVLIGCGAMPDLPPGRMWQLNHAVTDMQELHMLVTNLRGSAESSSSHSPYKAMFHNRCAV